VATAHAARSRSLRPDLVDRDRPPDAASTTRGGLHLGGHLGTAAVHEPTPER